MAMMGYSSPYGQYGWDIDPLRKEQEVCSTLRSSGEMQAYKEARRCLRSPIVSAERSPSYGGSYQMRFTDCNGSGFCYMVPDPNYYPAYTYNQSLQMQSQMGSYVVKTFNNSNYYIGMDTACGSSTVVRNKAPETCPKCKGAKHEEKEWYGMCAVQTRAFWNRAKKVYWEHHHKKLSTSIS